MSEEHKSQSGAHQNNPSKIDLRYNHPAKSEPVARPMPNPNGAICKIEASFDGPTKPGTGWMAGPRVLVTAAHVVYNNNGSPAYPTSIKIAPGIDGIELGSSNYIEILDSRTSPIQRVIHLPTERPAECSALDYAVIVLPHPLTVGSFGYKAIDINSIQGLDAYISGYPMRTDENRNRQMQSHAPVGADGDFITYKAQAGFGQSGSPVWFSDKDNHYWVIGIHIEGDPEHNRAIAISKQVEDFIDKFQE